MKIEIKGRSNSFAMPRTIEDALAWADEIQARVNDDDVLTLAVETEDIEGIIPHYIFGAANAKKRRSATLQRYVCPKCGKSEELHICIKAKARLIQTLDGNDIDSESVYHHSWNDDSPVECHNCEFADSASKFVAFPGMDEEVSVFLTIQGKSVLMIPHEIQDIKLPQFLNGFKQFEEVETFQLHAKAFSRIGVLLVAWANFQKPFEKSGSCKEVEERAARARAFARARSGH